jgi:alcohol dehydrogenase class IV
MWKFHNPTRVHFGDEWLDKLASLLPPNCKKALLITGTRAAASTGAAQRIRSALDKVQITEFTEIEPEPTQATVNRAREVARRTRPDAIIALGGGSVLDAAKVVAATHRAKIDLAALMNRAIPVPHRETVLIALPTTAGSGSEVTPFAVLTNAAGDKQSLPSTEFYPDIAVVAPTLVTTCPQQVAGDAGIDALAHALEALWSTQANPISDELAYAAVALVLHHLPVYYADRTDAVAASGMARAATLAGMAFSNTFTAACHALSYPIGKRYSLSHGAACGVTLHHVAQLNEPAIHPKFAILAERLQLRDAAAVPQAVAALRAHITTIPTLKQLAASDDDLRTISETYFVPLMNNNPVQMTHSEIVQFLQTLRDNGDTHGTS